MDKKAILAVGLSIAVLVIFQFFFKPQAPLQTTEPVPAQTETATTATTPSTTTAVTPASPVTVTVTPQKTTHEFKPYTVKNNNITLIFNELTGDIHEAQVTEFDGRTLVDISFTDMKSDYFSLDTGISTSFVIDTSTSTQNKIVFRSANAAYAVTKTYHIPNSGFQVKVTTELANLSENTINVPLQAKIGPGLGSIKENAQYIFTGPLMYDGKKTFQEDQDDVDEIITKESPKWVGYTSKYYLFAAASDTYQTATFTPAANESAVISGNESLTINPQTKQTRNFNLFIGPKQYNVTKDAGYGFEESLDFGWFYFLAIPMLKTLIFLYGFVGNYGVAIIILTIIIKLLTFPLTKKSMVSMKKMQAYQPKIAAIKEKYKGDQQKVNAATMELYKKEGINPVGGCLPMFLQIPIFFALYKTLMVAIELNGAPFFLWITDMSLKDPYYITPVLMGASMFFQQKLTPSAGDPMQQKIFLMMPIVFTFLFLNFPAGLVIYWLTNNVLTIIQQISINKKMA